MKPGVERRPGASPGLPTINLWEVGGISRRAGAQRGACRMSNYLVLTEAIYHNMVEDTKRIDKQFRAGASTRTPIIPNRAIMLLNVVAIVGDSCVEFLKK